MEHLAGVLDRAREVGVRYLVCNGSCEEDWPAVLALARRYPQVVPCFGLHPWYVRERTANWREGLESFLDAVPSGVGEFGLDRWIKDPDETGQREVFLAQWEIARRRNRPAMIHCLHAWGPFLEILRSQDPLPAGMLIHAFTGPAELIPELTAMNAYISFTGGVLGPRRRKGREALARVPIDRLMLETDAPDFLPPDPYCPYRLTDSEGKARNEPANLPAILRGVAELLGRPAEDLAEILWANGRRFLGYLNGFSIE